MVDRPIALLPENKSLTDADYLIGGRNGTNTLQKSPLVDVITQRYNINSGWQLLDGTTTDIDAITGERYYIPSSAEGISFTLPDSSFGDTFTVYSETSNVFIKNQLGQNLFDVIPFSVTHLLYNGTDWINFSRVGQSSTSLVISKAKVLVGGFPGYGTIGSSSFFINKALAKAPSFTRLVNVTSIDEKISRTSRTAINNLNYLQCTFVNDFIGVAVVTTRNNLNYQDTTFIPDYIGKGDI